jgi:hypothetical protein
MGVDAGHVSAGSLRNLEELVNRQRTTCTSQDVISGVGHGARGDLFRGIVCVGKAVTAGAGVVAGDLCPPEAQLMSDRDDFNLDGGSLSLERFGSSSQPLELIVEAFKTTEKGVIALGLSPGFPTSELSLDEAASCQRAQCDAGEPVVSLDQWGSQATQRRRTGRRRLTSAPWPRLATTRHD